MLSEFICITASNNRGYRWNTPKPKLVKEKETHTDIFWDDIKEFTNEKQYYFGHFILSKDLNYGYTVVDGLQRLITVSVFASAILERLKKFKYYGSLNINEKRCFDDLIKIPSKIISIETINTLKINTYIKELVFEMGSEDQEAKIKSIKRIIKSFEYFINILSDKSGNDLMVLLNTISEAHCTTYCLELSNNMDEHQIYQAVNFRGKKISRLLDENSSMFF